MKNKIILLYSLLIIYSCNQNNIPKPYGYYRIELPENKYEEFKTQYFSFHKSVHSKIDLKNKNFINIYYPKMNATIHCTYKNVNNNINQILEDVEKFTYNHTIKAETINESIFENEEKNIFGMLFKIEGNTATNIQFYATDKKKNILSGSLYFYSSPNYDSVLPCIKYIEKDIRVIMQTIEWK